MGVYFFFCSFYFFPSLGPAVLGQGLLFPRVRDSSFAFDCKSKGKKAKVYRAEEYKGLIFFSFAFAKAGQSFVRGPQVPRKEKKIREANV
jgi:hypothetical protein